ncbi:MAG: hypothetical protein CR968_00560 [Flavobacteriia bacterium]|nr:MAG: hypothetical protein CR968_00560 [Flavobacteriia bacterium]
MTIIYPIKRFKELFFRQNKKPVIFAVVALVIGIYSGIYAQSTGSYWQYDMGYGSIIEHKNGLSHLNTAHPTLYRLSYITPSDTTSRWKRRFNYPDQGFSVMVQDFHNSTLGQTIGINYHTLFYLFNRNKQHQLMLDLGLGFAYATKTFNFETNYKNNVIGSPVTIAPQLSLLYRLPIRSHWAINSGFSFTHYSCASFKQPNNGINAVFIRLGASYRPRPEHILYPPSKKPPLPGNRTPHMGIVAKLGMHESYPGLGTKIVYEISPYISKQIQPLGHLNLGIDLINSQADKTYANYLYTAMIEEPNRTLNDHKRLGLYVGYEHFFNKISCEADLGYYLYKTMDHYMDTYQTLKIKYHLKQSDLRIGLGLRIHMFKANYSTIDIQYQWL